MSISPRLSCRIIHFRWHRVIHNKKFLVINSTFKINTQWRVVHLVWQAGIFFFFFPFIEKLYFLVCSSLSDCKPEAVCWGIAIRATVEQTGVYFYITSKKENINFQLVKPCAHVSLSTINVFLSREAVIILVWGSI